MHGLNTPWGTVMNLEKTAFQSYEQAAEYYKQAANEGYAAAQNNLETIFYRGLGGFQR